MSGRAWMPFYWGDYLRDTQHLSTVEHGAYLLLISAYWTNANPLPNCDRKLSQIVRLERRQWARIRPTIEPFFKVTPGPKSVWIHKRIEFELDKIRAMSIAGKIGASKRWSKDSPLNRGANPHPNATPYATDHAIGMRSASSRARPPLSKIKPSETEYPAAQSPERETGDGLGLVAGPAVPLAPSANGSTVETENWDDLREIPAILDRRPHAQAQADQISLGDAAAKLLAKMRTP